MQIHTRIFCGLLQNQCRWERPSNKGLLDLCSSPRVLKRPICKVKDIVFIVVDVLKKNVAHLYDSSCFYIGTRQIDIPNISLICSLFDGSSNGRGRGIFKIRRHASRLAGQLLPPWSLTNVHACFSLQANASLHVMIPLLRAICSDSAVLLGKELLAPSKTDHLHPDWHERFRMLQEHLTLTLQWFSHVRPNFKGLAGNSHSCKDTII